MSIREADTVVCVGRGVSHCTPVIQIATRGLYDSDRHQQKNVAIQAPHQSKMLFEANELKSKGICPGNTHGISHPASAGASDIKRRDCFSKSAKYVLQYADLPIELANHHLGRPTRASVLRNLKRSQSASSVCSDFSWIQDNRRLCNIRDYYRLYKAEPVKSQAPNGEPIHGYITGARFNSARWLDSATLNTKGLYIDKQNLGNVFLLKTGPAVGNRQQYGAKHGKELLEVRGKAIAKESKKVILKDATVNTDDHFLSLHRWHGAKWQHQLPEMHQTSEEKYNPYASVVVRAKLVKSEYRDPMSIPFIKKNQS